MLEQPKTRPEWLRETTLVSAALPEPPLVRKYAGGQPLDVDQEYERALREETLESLVAAGVTLVWVRFYSGFGLEFEKAEIERVRDFMVRAQARGLRVAAAVQLGLVVPETLLLEEQECHNWLQVNADGQHVLAGGHAAGVRPCYNCEGFLRYAERVCLLAVDAGADLVQLENVSYNLEPDTCCCPLCVAAFRDFLRQQYGAHDEKTRQAGLARFGHNSFIHVRPPAMEDDWSGSSDVRAPHEQEWMKFKVRTLTACLGRLSQAITRRDPECAVGADLLRGRYSLGETLHGVSYPAHIPLVDFVRPARAFSIAHPFSPYGESPGGAPEHPAGEPKSPELAPAYLHPLAVAAELKLAHAFGVAAETSAGAARELKLLMAWGLATETNLGVAPLETGLALNLMHNPFGLGCLAEDGPLGSQEQAAREESMKTVRAYLDFYTRHKAALLSARSLAAVAIYHDTANELFWPATPHGENQELEAKLEAGGWNCEPLYPNQFPDISRYRCVVVACARLLADEAVQVFTRYVEAGGGLVVFSHWGKHDEWGRERAQPALAALLGPDYLDGLPALTPLCYKGEPPKPLQRQVGAGRVAFVSWARSDEGTLAAVSFAAGGAPPWSVQREGTRPLSWAVQAADGTLLLHAAELSLNAPAGGLRCSIACDKQPQQVLPCAPGREFAPVAFTWENGRASFELSAEAAGGQMPRYVMFRAEFQAAQQ
ncbi:MAG: alpha-amylase family protein [Planctomycetota bacterium]